jgi:HlyD family secretion protein
VHEMSKLPGGRGTGPFMLQHRAGIAVVIGFISVCAVAAVAVWITQSHPTTPLAAQTSSPEAAWEAVAPGRVEPASGETKITPVAGGLVGEVLVKPNDKVFAGEPLIRLHDDEVRGRLVAADAQVTARLRGREDQKVSGKAADRRRAEDAVSETETDVFNARAALDASAIARRLGGGSDAALGPARAALSRAQDQLRTRMAALRAAEAAEPIPSEADAMLAVARAERAVARAAVEKMTIRAPIAGTVLQVNVRQGETAMPSATPLLRIGDVSSLRVRAELDGHDVGNIHVGQSVIVRAAAFPGRDFSGKVASIAPSVEPASLGARGAREPADVDVVVVMVELVEPGPLASGMRVDAYFRRGAGPAH